LGESLPGYARCARAMLSAGPLRNLDEQTLRRLHNERPEPAGSNAETVSLLDVKIELARRMLSGCRLCERRCGADRTAGETGFCGVGNRSNWFFEQVLWGEEPPLVPSHEVFFSGCNLRCSFCYSWQSMLDPSVGEAVEPGSFAAMVDSRRAEGAVNLNLIGGEPTIHLPAILEALRLVTRPTAVVWNSNFYMSAETMSLLDGAIDLYLGDFRFGCDECARTLGGVDRYVETAARNFQLAARSSDLIIRHLLIPGHIECCLKPIAKWVAERLPEAPFNLMFQYTPFFEALDDPALCRSLTPEEEKEALRIVSEHKLNTTSWRRPLSDSAPADGLGKGEISTTIAIRPDGRVAVMHLHGDLVQIVRSLEIGGSVHG